jgi:acetoacetyl-CoA synthetase
MAESEIIWRPGRYELEESPMARFIQAVNKKHNLKLQGYPQLHVWSVDPNSRADFWMTLFEHLDIKVSTPPDRAFENVSLHSLLGYSSPSD